MKKMEEFKWEEEQFNKRGKPIAGDIAVVTIPVKVIFEWSDKIIKDHDYPKSDWVEYTSGLVMRVLPQTVVYNNENIEMHLHQVQIEKP